jgi:hypothetical protein
MENNEIDSRSRTEQTARNEAAEKLEAEGWVFVRELAEWRHATKGQGVLAFEPDMGSLANGRPTHVRAVKLLAPGRAPTMDDLRNRVATAPSPIDVIRYW